MNEFKEKYTYDYPRPAMTSDAVVLTFNGKEIEILLIQRGQEPFKGFWALPGGFMKMDETIEECTIRELREETGIDNPYLTQFKVFSSVDRDPRGRVVTVASYALIKKENLTAGDDADNADWFTIPQTNELQLAFDHEEIIREAFNRLREDIHFRPVGFELLDDEFTMAQLQRIYEQILNTKFDRRNFQKKMLKSGVIQEVDESQCDFEDCCCFEANAFQADSQCEASLPPEILFSQTPEKETPRRGKIYSFCSELYNIMKDNDSKEF